MSTQNKVERVKKQRNESSVFNDIPKDQTMKFNRTVTKESFGAFPKGYAQFSIISENFQTSGIFR